MLLCSLCGSTGVHVRCGGLPFTAKSWSCSECLSATGTTSDAPSDSPARSTRHCTRRAREAGEEEGGDGGDGDGGDGSASPKRIKLERNMVSEVVWCGVSSLITQYTQTVTIRTVYTTSPS